MGIYHFVLIFLIGLVLGSFFNVVVFRFGSKKSIVKGRSRCQECNSTIGWFDLIPVISYFMLKGRCRECKKKISPLYSIVEISTAFALMLLFLKTPEISLLSALTALTVLILTLIIFLDLRYLIIPDKLLIVMALAAVGSKIIANNTGFAWLLIYAFGLTSFFAILFIASRGKLIGLGDIKLIFLIGFLLGYPVGYLAVISAIWLAAISSMILLVSRKVTAKTEIPFGSFLSIATIIFIIFNRELQEVVQYFQ